MSAAAIKAMCAFLDNRRRKTTKPQAWAIYQREGYTKFVDILDNPKPPVKDRTIFWTEMPRST